MGYFYILGTLIFTVYGQIILKWRLKVMSLQLPNGLLNKLMVLLKVLLDPFVVSAFVSGFIASLFWMAAMTKFEISKAYPFMSLAPSIVFLFGVAMLGEEFTWGKLIGLAFIMIGIFITVNF